MERDGEESTALLIFVNTYSSPSLSYGLSPVVLRYLELL